MVSDQILPYMKGRERILFSPFLSHNEMMKSLKLRTNGKKKKYKNKDSHSMLREDPCIYLFPYNPTIIKICLLQKSSLETPYQHKLFKYLHLQSRNLLSISGGLAVPNILQGCLRQKITLYS